MCVNDHTRYIAASPGVRRVLVEKQREIGRRLGSIVTEGRDQGSVAFPDADIKFYMDAEANKRAERRLHELWAEGEEVTLEQVLANVRERDRTDAGRSAGPLRVPRSAIRIDTTALSIGEVVELVLTHLRRAGLIGPGADEPGRAPHSSPPSP